jgi:hypothetical protein
MSQIIAESLSFGLSVFDLDRITHKQLRLFFQSCRQNERRQTELFNHALNVANANMHRKKGQKPFTLWESEDNQMTKEQYDKEHEEIFEGIVFV